MVIPVSLPIASIEAARPVFMIVMGALLMVVAWRLARNAEGWTGRFMMAGAFLLFFGYAFLIPMYEAEKIEQFFSGGHIHSSSAAVGWHAVKLVVMNAGWLLFGLGLGLHSGLIHPLHFVKSVKQKNSNNHESVA